MNRKFALLGGLMALALVTGTIAGCSTAARTPLEVSPLQIKVNSQQEGIWVSGQGKVTVEPDIANISLGIEAQASTVSDAQAQAASAMDKVMDVLTRNGVAKKDIQTQRFNISRVTRWDDKNQREIVIGYRVTNTVSAKIRDIDKAGATIDAVAQAGGDLTRINSIYFSIDDPTAYQNQAREKALADAKAKAAQMASLTGVKLGKATYITENLSSPSVPMYRGAAMDAGAAPAPTTPISPGQMDLAVTVQVVFAIAG